MVRSHRRYDDGSLVIAPPTSGTPTGAARGPDGPPRLLTDPAVVNQIDTTAARWSMPESLVRPESGRRGGGWTRGLRVLVRRPQTVTRIDRALGEVTRPHGRQRADRRRHEPHRRTVAGVRRSVVSVATTTRRSTSCSPSRGTQPVAVRLRIWRSGGWCAVTRRRRQTARPRRDRGIRPCLAIYFK